MHPKKRFNQSGEFIVYTIAGLVPCLAKSLKIAEVKSRNCNKKFRVGIKVRGLLRFVAGYARF